MCVRATVSLLVAAVLLAACGGNSDDPSAPIAATASGSVTPTVVTGAGTLLSEEQTRAAVLSVADLPTGWSIAEFDDSDSDFEFQPAECTDLFESFAEEPDTTVHKAGVTFSQGGDFGTELTMEVETHSDTFEMDKEIEAVTEVLEKCGSMTTEIEGRSAKVKLSELSVPQLGEASRGVRMEVELQGLTMTGDLVMVGVGHNNVGFSTFGFEPIPPAELDEIVRAGFAKLEHAAATPA